MKYLLMSALLFFNTIVFAKTIENNDSLPVNKLSEVTITAYKNTYKVDSSIYVSKLPLKDLENPQVYNTISKILLKDQIVTNLNDALKNATGVYRLWESTGRGGDGAEYYTMRGFSVQPTIVNGIASINNGTLDPANTENIEVIKGPSGALFGGSLISYGGLINIVTKKPYQKFGGEIGYVGGSFGLNRMTADINAPLSNNLFVRINTAFQHANTFQDAGFNQSFFISPSLKFIANEKLTFLINTEYKNSESANAPMIFLSRYSTLSFSNLDLFLENYKKSYTSNSLTIKNPTYSMQAQSLYNMGKGWNSQTIISRGATKNDGYYHYLWDSANGDEFTRYISKRNGATYTTDIQQNFTGDNSFLDGNIQNKVVIGFDYLSKAIENNSTGWVGDGIVSLVNQTDSGSLTTQGVDALLVNSSEGVSTAKTTILSSYISDVIAYKHWVSLMLSLRVDNFSGSANYWSSEEIDDQTGFSPKLGLVIQPVKNKLSVFANYMNGFVNLDPQEIADVDGQNPHIKVFDPEKANQWEFGVKTNLYKDKISLTASYYDITVSNKLMTDPANPNNQIQGGKVNSNGLELSLITNPIEGLNIVTGYSHNSSKVTKDATDGGYLGLRPEEAGPENLFNFWANYKIKSGALKNFGIGLGSNYAGEAKILNRSNIGTFTLPGYTVFNSVISYNSNQYSILFKVDNIGNKKYFSGWSTVTPQRTRSFSLALNYKF